MLHLMMSVFIFVSLLCIATAVPLMRRWVPPNGSYGLRVSATLADEWVWYEANARTGRDLLVLGVVELVVALVPALVLPMPWVAHAILNTMILTIGAVLIAIVGAMRANSLLKQRQHGE